MKERKAPIDLHGFRRIYDLYYDSLCRYLLFYTEDIDTVEDIVQEVFLSLWENRAKMPIEYPKTYLFRAARNKVLNHLRDKKKHLEILDAWFYEQLEEREAGSEKFDIERLLNSVDKAVHLLPQKCREIFLLSKARNLTYQQIADSKQISRKTVEAQMGIALKKIREYLASNPHFLFFLLIFRNFF